MPNPPENEHFKKQVRILSLNGGGARGLFTISLLAEIERIVEEKQGINGFKVGDYFDLITGTSIGGILALGLAYGKSAKELEEVFRKQAGHIFPEQKYPRFFSGLRRKYRLARRPLYDSKPLATTIASMVGEDSTFNDLKCRVLIPTVNLSTGKPQFFKTPHNPEFNRDGRLKLIDAALATSAAPTYFAPHYCEDLDAYFADGGLVANNPSFIGLHEVFRDMTTDFPETKVSDVRILNVGTLGEEYSLSPSSLAGKSGYLGLWGMGERLVLSTMTANQQLHRAMLSRELATHDAIGNLVYLDDTIPHEAASDITLDNASESSLSNLASRGRQLATEEFTKNKALADFFKVPARKFK
ncbi:cGAMP-activated phospholipase [Vibrio harveyi]|jgi:patatin-like phospholipase/acyl hydrolase|uniref:CBASS cGAMP-activated phospholipase n=1 Tax=Vibrio harveyi group TaxID=717610 RepID=UPI000423F64F|nr:MULTISPECIES: CBASS cGAMP-activated phospholipase [Vibrio harveyi group]MCG9233528.1 cGAMP-activated phospholipase CapV [Vibrio harveyi]MCG9587560.1 cGAMP-activated phospholipase CapV [Vibrio harveyi]MCG9611164.1 cGAMP-activated phospholipase CapV [Vibrio harveyi]MCG9668289.1 cGAMP-activated phospholipase CapV [Vibrio harveyi]MDX8423777.1 cGAMP-activated phospholipase CapV [Vibrio parahaemolyticus]